MIKIVLNNFEISNNLSFVLIAGPCVIENERHSLLMAEKILKICENLKVNFIFKSSFDKANRTSIESERGVNIKEAFKIFKKIKTQFNCPILTDIHNEHQCEEDVVDIIQVPAFLCRQTDLLLSAAKTNKIINVKKGQFLSPYEVKNIFQKIESVGNKKILITERGTSLGYNNLISDFRSLEMIREGGNRIKDIRLVRMYFFRYEPVMDYKHNYDAFPLIFMLYEDPDNFSGINFHYLSPKLRAILLGHMFTFLTDKDFSNRTRLFGRKFMQVIRTNKRFRHAKAIFKNYRPENIQGKIIQVHPLDWELAIMVPTERFKTPTGGRIASKKIWRETSIKARTI